jgi:hypothetical protein
MLIHRAEEETRAGRAAVKERAAHRIAGTRPSHELVAYAGTYHDDGYGDLRISVEKESLMLAWSSFRTPLEHFQYDTFDPVSGRLSGSPVRFQLDESGAVGKLNFLDVDFTRVKTK